MEFQKTINLIEKTSDNKDLLKKRINNKKRKETEMEKPITSFTINLDSIV